MRSMYFSYGSQLPTLSIFNPFRENSDENDNAWHGGGP